MPAAPLLELQNVTKKFGKHFVLKDITCKIYQGEIFGIIGVSGGGKTTLLNILIGFYKHTSGDIVFNKRKHWKHITLVHKIFGFARQEGSYYPNLTVEENLRFFGRMYNMPNDRIEQRMKDLLNFMGLEDAQDKLAQNLSTGMQRRLDLACALIHEPAVLILDEPTEDLDPTLRKEMLSLITRVNQEEGTTIIITSHLLGELEDICTRIAILHEGSFVQIGSTLELKESYSQNQEVHFTLKSGNYQKLLKQLNQELISSVVTKPHQVTIYTPNGEKLLRNILTQAGELNEEIIELALGKPSLEEVFEALTQQRRSMK